MEWISVKDRLPELEGEYLCYIESFSEHEIWTHDISIEFFGKSIDIIERHPDMIIHKFKKEMDFECNKEGYISTKVSHWSPLPEPPKE